MKNSKQTKPVDIEFLRIQHNLKKICSCEDPQYLVDTSNRSVWCQLCGAYIDTFEALLYIAKHPENLKEQTNKLIEKHNALAEKHNRLAEEVRVLEGKRARLKVFKEMESSYRHDMLPHCPECEKMFHFERLAHWTNRGYCGCDVCKRS